jgi:hypothetical protein
LRWDDEVLTRAGLHRHIGRTNANRQCDLQRYDRADDYHRRRATEQQDRLATGLDRFDDDGRRVSVVVGHQAVGIAEVITGGKIRSGKVFGQGLRVDRAGAWVLCVSECRGR